MKMVRDPNSTADVCIATCVHQTIVTNDANSNLEPAPNGSGYTGTIEVVVLRCEGLPRPRAPNPSTSEKHPRVLQMPLDTSFGSFSAPKIQDTVIQTHEEESSSEFGGGLYDRATLFDEPHPQAMNFGGDMAWDDDEPLHSPHFNRDWYGEPYNASRPQGQQQNSDGLRGRGSGDVSIRSVPSSIPSSGPSPTIVINVNQPGEGAPAKQPWNDLGGQAINDDTWQTWMHDNLPQPTGRHSSSRSSNHRKPNSENQFGTGLPAKQPWNDLGGQTTNDDTWQTWMHAKSPEQDRGYSSSSNRNHQRTKGGDQRDRGSKVDSAWDYSRPRIEGNQNRDMSRGWDANNHRQQAQHNNNQDGGWYKNKCHGEGQSNGWDHNNDYKDDQPKRDGKNDWQNNTGNTTSGGWETHQSAAKSHHGNAENSNDQHGGGWNTNNDKNQGNNGWNDTAHNNDKHNEQSNHWNGGHNQNSGHTWDNANAGGQEAQPSGDQNWNGGHNQDSGHTWDKANAGGQGAQPSGDQNWPSGNDHADRSQEGQAINSPPASGGGGQDPWSSRSHHTSSKRAKSVKSNVSKPISVRPVVQNTHMGAPSQTGLPGAWPDTVQNPIVPGSHQDASNGFKKPYHVIIDAASNPRQPDMDPAPVVVAPPSPPPVAAMQTSSYFQGGHPTVYYHKIASPKYMDTHEKPYASKLDSTASVRSVPVSVQYPTSNWNGNAGSGPSGNGFGAALHDKLGAAAAQQNDTSSSSSSGDKNARNTNKGNAKGWPASESGGAGHVAAWLNKTPTGRSVNGHNPWGGSGSGSNKGQSGQGGNEDRGGIQKSGSWNKNDGGHGSQSGGWNGSVNGKNDVQNRTTRGANGGGGPSSGW
ncbi:MAG: hypothetical protein Q9202_002377 [Teloschistes flavicans]